MEHMGDMTTYYTSFFRAEEKMQASLSMNDSVATHPLAGPTIHFCLYPIVLSWWSGKVTSHSALLQTLSSAPSLHKLGATLEFTK